MEVDAIVSRMLRQRVMPDKLDETTCRAVARWVSQSATVLRISAMAGPAARNPPLHRGLLSDARVLDALAERLNAAADEAAYNTPIQGEAWVVPAPTEKP